MSTVFIPEYLVTRYSLPSEYQSIEGTIEKILNNLASQYPSVKPFLYDDCGRIRRFVNIFLDGEDIRGLAGIESTVDLNSEIVIVLAIAGG
jgi:hypothetical protein